MRRGSVALVLLAVWAPLVLGMLCARPADAASFHLIYDDTNFGIIGTGTFGYSGPATVGSFALSSLVGVTYDAILRGNPYTTAHIVSDPSTTGISVFSLGGGQFGLVFTGNGGTPRGGSLELLNSDLDEGFGDLSHEPTSAIDDPIGCCGGNGMINVFFGNAPNGLFVGHYSASTPEPGSLALMALGLLGLAASRRSRSLQGVARR